MVEKSPPPTHHRTFRRVCRRVVVDERPTVLSQDGTDLYVSHGILPWVRRKISSAPQLSRHAGNCTLPSLCHGHPPPDAHPLDALRSAKTRIKAMVRHRAVYLSPAHVEAMRARAEDEGGGWLVRFIHPAFAYVKIAGFLMLEISLAVLIIISLWAVCTGSQDSYRNEAPSSQSPPPAGK